MSGSVEAYYDMMKKVGPPLTEKDIVYGKLAALESESIESKLKILKLESDLQKLKNTIKSLLNIKEELK